MAKLLTVAEAAEQYGKSEPAFRWMIHQGIAPRSAKIGGRRLFRQEDIDEHIATAFGGKR